MKFEPLFPINKKKKKPLDKQIIETDAQLRTLEDQFRLVISREVRALRNNRNNKRAQDKIKNAMYSLQIIQKAQEQLRDIDTTHELNKSMNSLSLTLKALNGISLRSDSVNGTRLQKRIDKMEKNGEKRGGGMSNVLGTDVDALISDDIIERLINGESIDKCLQNPDGELKTTQQALFTDESLLDQINFEKDVQTGELEDSAAILEELMKNMK